MAINSASFTKVSSLCLLVLGLILIGSTGYRVFDQYYRAKEQPAQSESSKTPAAVGSVSYNLSAIVEAHLFGRPQVEKPTVQEAPQTKLSLRLLGLLGSNSEKYARALIRVNSGQIKAYAIGDQIAGTDAKIHSVEKQKVILDRGGNYESLSMERAKVETVKVVYNNLNPAAEGTESAESGSRSGSVPF